MAECKASIEPFFTWDQSDRVHDALLVIGNGFDIECGLPTHYSDFLDFVSFLEFAYHQLFIPIDCANAPVGIAALEPYLSTQSVSRLKAAFGSIEMQPGFHPAQTNAYLRQIVANDSALLSDIARHIRRSDWETLMEDVPKCLRPTVLDQISSGELPICDWVPLFDNYWYKHFKRVQIGKNWVDFEAEIARVIRALEYSMIDGRAHRAYADDKVSCTSPFDLEGLDLPEVNSTGANTGDSNGTRHVYPITYRNIRDILLKDLIMLTDRFECYIRDYVEGIDVEETPVITHMLDTLQGVEAKKLRILNFNYTSTLSRFLEKRGMNEAVTCHVHGQVNGNSPVVLGMDEYLSDDKISEYTVFASFRKYNQRIQRNTDNSYMQWIKDQWSYVTAAHEVIIFGHSIGASDWDLLRPLIKKGSSYKASIEGVRTAVYYYNDDAFSDILANITGMLDKDYVIERTGPVSCTLKFIDQQNL